MGSGKRTSRVTKQLAFQQLVWDCGAIDRHTGTVRTRTKAMEDARNDFLARTAFAGNQHRRIRRGYSLHEHLDTPHQSMFTDEID